MAADLNFEAKTDRELLLLTAQKVNDMAENCKQFREAGDCNNGLSKKAKTGLWGALITGVVALGLGIIEIVKR
jgi:hypothetical protein